MTDGDTTRRHVVVLFIDLVGSTALAERFDPELIRHILDRYYRACADAVDEYGGVVEKYIGDAIMALFGAPRSHEDDAQRAVQAAYSARSTIASLSAELERTHDLTLDVHCGIAAGEAVVVDNAGSDLRVVGDTVNVASRLQGIADDGEIVISDSAARMVHSMAELEELPPLDLKGKRDPVRAWRVLALNIGRVPDEDAVPLVNRVDELDQLHQAYQRVQRGRQCCLVTILGPPGIGKSRLARSFVQDLGHEATVLRGQCPPYGAGATYRPLAQLLESLNGEWARISEILPPRAVKALRDIAGTEHGAHGIEEVSHAVRALLEHVAQQRPLVVVIDDVQWAEPTFLDLLQEAVAWLVDAPVLVLCLARAELLDRRPAWGGGMACTLTMELGPLESEHMHRLLACHQARMGTEIGTDVMAHSDEQMCLKAADYSDGNPLVGELMLHRLVEDGIDAQVPPTVHALIAARLDQLDRTERDVLERAATVGQTFTVEHVAMLDQPDNAPLVETSIRQLLRRRLVRRGTDHGTYEFAQSVTREIAYSLASKAARGHWHLTLADDVDVARTGAEPLFDGTSLSDRTRHLESACLLKREVVPDDPTLPELCVRAARALIADGSRALHQRDLPAAIALLLRGRELLPIGHPDHRVLAVRCCDAALAQGDRAMARDALDVGRQMLVGDRRADLTFQVQRHILAVRHGEPILPLAELRDRLDDESDDLTWCRFHQLEMLISADNGRFGDAEEALRNASARSAALGDRYEMDRSLGGLCELAQWSPTPIPEALALCDAATRRLADDRALLVPLLVTRARLSAQADDLPGGYDALESATRHTTELHLDAASPAVSQAWGIVESLAGRHDVAHRHFRRAAEHLRNSGHTVVGFTLEIHAVHELLRQGRKDAAARALSDLTVPGKRQLRGEFMYVAIQARLAALNARHDDAVPLVTALEKRVKITDDPCLSGDVLVEIARVHQAAGASAQCRHAAAAALAAYAAKGATLLVDRVRNEFDMPGGVPA